jgi:hypothetical protein
MNALPSEAEGRYCVGAAAGAGAPCSISDWVGRGAGERGPPETLIGDMGAPPACGGGPVDEANG